MVRVISIILIFSFSLNALAFGGKNNFFRKPFGTGKRSVGANTKRATKAIKRVVKKVTRETGRAVNYTVKVVGNGAKNVVKTTAKAIDDTGRNVAKASNDVSKTIIKAKSDTDREFTQAKRNVDRELTQAKRNIDRELTKAYQNVRREGGKGFKKVGAVLENAGQPENLLTIAVVYTASIYAGPMGSALANSLITKIKNPNVSDKELFNSFVIGAAAGYAAQGATDIPIKSLQSMPSATRAIARNLTVDAGNILLNGKDYNFDDFVASIGKGAVNINTGEGYFNEIIDSSLNASTDYTIDRLAHKQKIDLDELEIAIYKGMANGVTRESVHALVDKYIAPMIPEEHKGLDKKLFGVLAEVFVQKQLSIDEKILNKFENLDEVDQREILEELQSINIEFKEYLAQKLGKDASHLTYDDLSSELSISLHEEFVSLKLEQRLSDSSAFERLNLSKEEMKSIRRDPASGYLVKVFLIGLTVYGYYETFQEAKRIEKVYKQFKKETGKSFEEFVKENPNEFKDITIDAALAMLPTIGVVCKELKIGMKQSAKLVSAAKNLSKRVNRNILQDILSIKKQKGLGDIAAGTKSQAEAIGKTWVNGKNIRRFKLGKDGYGITDGVRTFRLQYKPKSGSWKANFQENTFNSSGKAIETKNVHMTITDIRE